MKSSGEGTRGYVWALSQLNERTLPVVEEIGRHMPGGFFIYRASGRQDEETIPIIALTANAFDEDVQRSLQAGLNAHLSKPVQPEALYGTLESLIQQ